MDKLIRTWFVMPGSHRKNVYINTFPVTSSVNPLFTLTIVCFEVNAALIFWVAPALFEWRMKNKITLFYHRSELIISLRFEPAAFQS